MLPASLVVKSCRFLLSLLLLSIAFSVQPDILVAQEKVDMPIGSVGGNVRADLFTGTATTSIPIAVPPGRKGIQPQLALVYGSANGNGWVGMGWKLEKSVIDRQTKFGLDYAGDDYRVSLSGINADLVTVGIDEYRAKIEGSFTRVMKLTAVDGQPYFEATDKTGTKYLFGQTAASRMADPGNPSLIFRWCLDRVEDVHGNYMTISYSIDQNQAYLSRIDYTGNSLQNQTPTHSVRFHLEDRTDAPPLYYTKYLTKIAKRLKTIEVRANGNLVRAYKLTYTTSASTQRSLLATVQQFGKDATIDANKDITGGTSLPTQVVSWPSTFSQFFKNTKNISTKYGMSKTHWAADQRDLAVGDYNGDGLSDLILQGVDNGQSTYLLLADGSGGFLPPQDITNLYGMSSVVWAKDKRTITVADFNGDGRSDLLLQAAISGGHGTHLLLADESGGFLPQKDITNLYGMNINSWVAGFRNLAVGDFNGDGFPDLLLQGTHHTNGSLLLLADGSGGFLLQSDITNSYGMSPDLWSATNRLLYVGDFDGDGRSDLLLQGRNQTHNTLLVLADGNGSGVFKSSQTITNSYGMNSNLWSGFIRRLSVGDFNGDGRSDLLLQGDYFNATFLLMANGSGGFLPQQNITNSYDMDINKWNFYWRNIAVGDFNGDGRSDILLQGTGFGTTYTRLLMAGGSDIFLPQQDITDAFGMSLEVWVADVRTLAVGDFNGDGRSDLLLQGNDGNSGTHFLLAEDIETDLLSSMSNGYGGSATIAYLPSTQYSNTLLPYPVQTVRTITTDDGNGNVATSTYDFSGGYHHLAEREFRGFDYAKVTGPVGPNGEQAIEETFFHQGNDTAVDVNDPSVADGYLKGAVYRKRVTDGAGNLFTETQTTYTADDDGLAPFYTPPAQIITDICNGGTCTAQTQTDFTYDIYGNVTQEIQRKDVVETTDDLTIVRTFSPNTTDWILGLPTSETIYEGIGTTGTQLTLTDFYYDGTTSCNVASTNQLPTKGLLTRTVKWLSASADPETRIAYDDFGNPVCSRNANGNTTSMSYDSEGFFETTFTDSLGFVTTTEYYGVGGIAADNGIYGQVKEVADPNGATVSTAYDALGRILSVTQPDNFVTTTSYNNFGTLDTQNILNSQHVRSDSPLGLSTFSYFDGMGRKILAKGTGTDGKIIVSTTEYDVRGAVKQSSLPYFEVGGSPLYTTVTYDTAGRVLQTVNPDGSRTLTCYDDWVQVSINANDQRKRVVQDADGRAIAVQEYLGTYTTCDTDPGTPYSTTLYLYDVLGNLRFVTDTQGNQSEMRYDELSRKVFMHDPDMGDWTYAYDTVGNLTLQTDAKGQQIHFQYDVLNRQVQKDFGTQKTLGTGDVVYTFDGATSNGIGRLTNVADSSGSSTFFYDIAGRGTKTDKVIGGTTYTTQSAYDGLGRITTLTYPDNSSITHTYNGPQLESVQEGTTTYVSYAGFNALGQPATVTSGNGVVTTYTYDAQNFRLATLKTVNSSITLQDLGYTFDAGGNVTGITNPIHGNQVFTYDDLNRLTNATGMTANPTTYSYDQLGNMLSNSRIGTYNYAEGAQTASIPSSGSNAFAGANQLERYLGVQTASLPIAESRPYALWAPEEKIDVADYHDWTLVRNPGLLTTATILTQAAVAQTPAVVFHDDFTGGVDNATIAGTVPDTAGTDWIELENSTGSSFAQLRHPEDSAGGSTFNDDGYAYQANYGAVGSADVDIEATCSRLDTDSFQPLWILGRWADVDNMFAVAVTQNATGKAKLYKIVAGTSTLLGTSSSTPAEGDTVKLEMRGSAIKVYINGVEEISVTEASDLTAAGKSGLGFGAIHGDFSTYDLRSSQQVSSFKVTEIGTGGSTVTVPDVVGQTQASATTTITGAGLVLGTVTTQSSSTVASGDVISQTPASGASVAANSAVDIVVSTGPSSSSSTVIFDDGLVGSAGTKLDAHTPDVVGTSWTFLSNPGLDIVLDGSGTANADSEPVATGILYSADPAPSVADVDIVVDMEELDSSDDDSAIMVFRYQDASNFYGLRLTADNNTRMQLYKVVSGVATLLATSINEPDNNGTSIKIEARGNSLKVYEDPAQNGSFNLEIDVTDSAITSAGKVGYGLGGVIISTDDIKNNPVLDRFMVEEFGSGAPPPQVTVPNVVGLAQATATTAITGAGLVLGTVTTQSSATVASGDVISQTPVSGTSVASGSVVDIVVSSGPPPPVTLDIRVSAGSDDAEEDASGTMNLTSSDLDLTVDNSIQHTVGMRFNGLNIPQGATIISATLQFQADEANSGTTPLTIQGENATNAPTFTSSTSNITSRPLTSASVAWSPNPWDTVGEAGVNQLTPDISSVIQEIVGLPGWASGNSLAVVISGTGTRTAESYDGVSSAAPLLHVEFTTGPAQVTVPNVVGLAQAVATTSITGAGLVLGTVTTQSSATVASGDVISQTPVGGTSVAANSAVNIVVSSGPAPVASGGGPHAVKVAGTFIYGYDANGNMTSGPGRTIVYDFENRPTSITQGGVTTSFKYDGDGGRVQKTDGTNTTVYIGKLYVCENGSCTKFIFANGQRVAQKEVDDGATSYYHPDHLGSTSVVTDAAGNNEQDLAYYPYGDTFLNVGSKDVKFKYTGKERDDSTGLYFYEARYYDPFLGRFISADTIVPDPLDPQALNRYSYVLNNPILYTDPTGHCPMCFIIFTNPAVQKAAIGFGIGFSSGIASSLLSDNEFWSWQTLQLAVVGGTIGAFTGGSGSATKIARFLTRTGFSETIATGTGHIVTGALAGASDNGINQGFDIVFRDQFGIDWRRVGLSAGIGVFSAVPSAGLGIFSRTPVNPFGASLSNLEQTFLGTGLGARGVASSFIANQLFPPSPFNSDSFENQFLAENDFAFGFDSFVSGSSDGFFGNSLRNPSTGNFFDSSLGDSLGSSFFDDFFNDIDDFFDDFFDDF